MAQFVCPDCGETLSDDLETCPNCGFPLGDYLHGFDREAPVPAAPVPEPEVCVPHCPVCGSAELVKLSQLDAYAKAFFFGVMGSGNLGKTWECQNCGSKF